MILWSLEKIDDCYNAVKNLYAAVTYVAYSDVHSTWPYLTLLCLAKY